MISGNQSAQCSADALVDEVSDRISEIPSVKVSIEQNIDRTRIHSLSKPMDTWMRAYFDDLSNASIPQ